MTPLKLLILHSAIYRSNPLFILFEEDKMEQGTWWGFSFPCVEKEEMIQSLFELYLEGYLAFETCTEGEVDESLLGYPDIKEFAKSVDAGSKVSYLLTETGGAVWEKEVRADWARYISVSWTFAMDVGDSEDEIEITSSSMSNVRWALHHEEQCGLKEVEGTFASIVLTPWQVTYWKSLPIGYQVRYQRTRQQIVGRPPSGRFPPAWFDDTVLVFGRRSYPRLPL